MKKIIFLAVIIFSAASAQPEFSSINSMPGAFSRMGFGARGIGMGNALSAVTEGNLVAYYNPAVSVFQEGNSFQTSYSFLSLDRSHNFLNFTRRFDFYSLSDTAADRKPRSIAGLSLGLINAGVSNIDGRDNQGFKTGELSTSENQFFMAVANKFSEKVSIGISIKVFYYKLYEEITSSGVGFDAGILYRWNEYLNVSFVFTDFNSKYKWDTAPVYKLQGKITENKFPQLRRIGLSYKLTKQNLLMGFELQNSNAQSNIIRLGAEYQLIDNFYVRGGIDNFNLSNTDQPVRPSAGFSYSKTFGNINIGIDYAFAVEQYSAYDRHIVGVFLIF